MNIDIDKLEQIKADYSKWIAFMPEQLPGTVKQSNRSWEVLKGSQMRRLSKRYNVPLKDLEDYFKV